MVYRWLYSLLLYLVLPLALLWLHWPKGSKPMIGRRWPEHLGFVPPVAGNPLWLHAVSVGEVIAISPLIHRLLELHPNVPLLVTTTTRTGADRLKAAFPTQVVHRYAPFDLPDATNRFLRRVKPRLAVMMEMELWPNTMAACRARQVPSVLINARMSEKSFRGYERFRRLITPVLQSFQQILAQSDEDAERIVRLGADAFRVEVSGSVKYDIRLDEADIKAGENLRQRLAANRPVWIAASTHGGEDELLLQAHGQVLKHYPDALLIIVPRHPQRFDAVATLCEKQAKMLGITFARRSQSKEERGVGVYLADTMGEMFTLLAASDICFMGGSLIPNGGHNLLEPAAVGMPTLIGPHDFNFTEITRLLVAAGNCQRVTDEHDLAAALIALFDDPSVAATAADAGRQVVANNQGALALTLSHIDEALAAGLSVH